MIAEVLLLGTRERQGEACQESNLVRELTTEDFLESILGAKSLKQESTVQSKS